MKIPHHLAVIMDGNGRWAKEHGVPRQRGHQRGAEKLYEMANWLLDYGVAELTVYAFSTENWQRSKFEVEALLRLLPNFLDQHEEELRDRQIRFSVFGDLSRLDRSLQERLNNLAEDTKNFQRFALNICFSYGSRDEIIRAIKKLAEAGVDLSGITEADFSNALDSRDSSDPELLIRTGGELRLSNFLLWQLAYTELYFTDKLWPDFTREDLEEAFTAYGCRQRRFGRR